ncbi:voltage-gated sodium channel [Planomicrobium soli]|uniref:Voltage-gated sodium channel n=1 Tax=Planomicrobium soli TaxID=1176648 RepID=A0A2P8H5S5_9BACL|nr:ion transporter [Planomicrobium soli]PSL41576.1 voltage-gated sodium channel [Planomicrobium soli]
MKDRMIRIMEGKRVTNFITILILINAILVGLETYPDFAAKYSTWLLALDFVILGFFTLEILIKLYLYRTKFFRNGWNNFDFIIVVGSLVLYNSPYISVLRIFRVLRVLRTITTIPSLRRVVAALFMAIPTITSVIVLMSIIFYVYAVIGTFFYSSVEPEFFGNLGLSFITLFQVFTLESWASGVFRPIFEVVPWSWLYFVSFIVISTFLMINLIVGEIVNNAQKISEEIDAETAGIIEELSEIDELKAEVAELKTMIQTLVDRK